MVGIYQRLLIVSINIKNDYYFFNYYYFKIMNKTSAAIIIQKYYKRYIIQTKILIPSSYIQTKIWRNN